MEITFSNLLTVIVLVFGVGIGWGTIVIQLNILSSEIKHIKKNIENIKSNELLHIKEIIEIMKMQLNNLRMAYEQHTNYMKSVESRINNIEEKIKKL